MSACNYQASSDFLPPVMCNLVVPIRTCSKCHRKERLFGDGNASSSDKLLGYMDPAQDCYSRWCVFSREHPKTCSHCWITCKHTHGKTREIQGGSPSYVCYGCAPRERKQQTWKPPRPVHTKTMPSQVPPHGFLGVSKLVTALAR
ncbi:hypothetical protein EDD16DRAFT_1724582 [Pisolithus croceorrhizus]|nr:hypothetical protein EDD16DRAFT_1724582 [Pisolithus croceorrhizus]